MFSFSDSDKTETAALPTIESRIFSWGIFFLPASALTTSIGPGLTEVLIFLGTLVYAKHLWRERSRLFGPAIAVLAAFAFNLAAAALSLALTDFQMRSLDNPIRELLAVAVIGLIVLHKPQSDKYWYGVFVGTIGAAGLALYQRLIMGMERSAGFNLSIMFGDIAVAMGMMSLASITLFSKTRWALLPYIAFLAGLLTSVLSGSRGGWITLVVCVIPLYVYGEQETRRRLSLIFGMGLVLFAIIVFIPKFNVPQRFSDAMVDINQYLLGNVNTSIGSRLEMWKGAWRMFIENPLLGVGRANFHEGLNALIARKFLSPAVQIYYHAHNDILQALATQGLVGGAALGGLYLAPLRFFLQCWRRHDAAQPYALAGVLLVVSYIVSGLTQVLFAHHLGTAFYAATVSVLVGLCLLNKAANARGDSLA